MPFWDLASKIYNRLRPGVGRNYVIITWIRRPTKRFLKILVEFANYFFFMINMELKR